MTPNIMINPDLGADIGIHSFGNDDAILQLVDTVNVACGMHAGDPSTMDRTVRAPAAAGVTVCALFGMAANDEKLMRSICEVAGQYNVPVYGLAGTAHEVAAAACGVAFVPEFYVDLDYGKDGNLIVERRPKERSLESVRARTMQALLEGTVSSVDGTLVPVTVQSICDHSDLPAAPAVAKTVREAIAAARAA